MVSSVIISRESRKLCYLQTTHRDIIGPKFLKHHLGTLAVKAGGEAKRGIFVTYFIAMNSNAVLNQVFYDND